MSMVQKSSLSRLYCGVLPPMFVFSVLTTPRAVSAQQLGILYREENELALAKDLLLNVHAGLCSLVGDDPFQLFKQPFRSASSTTRWESTKKLQKLHKCWLPLGMKTSDQTLQKPHGCFMLRRISIFDGRV